MASIHTLHPPPRVRTGHGYLMAGSAGALESGLIGGLLQRVRQVDILAVLDRAEPGGVPLMPLLPGWTLAAMPPDADGLRDRVMNAARRRENGTLLLDEGGVLLFNGQALHLIAGRSALAISLQPGGRDVEAQVLLPGCPTDGRWLLQGRGTAHRL